MKTGQKHSSIQAKIKISCIVFKLLQIRTSLLNYHRRKDEDRKKI